MQASSNSPLCAGDTLRLTATAVAGATYAWAGPGGFISDAQNPLQPGIAQAQAGIYRVTVTTAGGCQDSAQVDVAVRPRPVIQLPDTAYICPGVDIIIPASGGTAPLRYAILGDTFQLSNNLGTRVGGVFSAIARDANGCADTALVFIFNGPRLTRVEVTPLSCRQPNGTATVIAEGTPPLTYAIGQSEIFQPGQVFTGLAEGNYTFRVRDANGCLAVRSAQVPRLPPLLISRIETQLAACGNANGSVQIQTVGGTPPILHSIHPDSLPVASNVFAGLRGGEYTVQVSDNAGCIATQTVQVPNAPCVFYLPSAFSPNDDGINDVLQVLGDAALAAAVVLEYKIFDRWGGLVYEAGSFPFFSNDRWWNGQIKGKPAPAGTYICRAVVAVNAEEIVPISGEVNLLRN